jgi:hypothetical protein
MSELTRLFLLSKVARSGTIVLIRATPMECSAVADRMGIPAVRFLECWFNLSREGDDHSIFAKGRLCAELTRVCVVSAEEFDMAVVDEFKICFVPSGLELDDPDPDLIDEIPYEGDLTDLGEATVNQLALALDPYPRLNGAVTPDFEHNERASPFSVLTHRLRT